LHGGLNLYNNGFAAGIVASVLAPIAIALHRRDPLEGDNQAKRADEMDMI
jgi:hypothetical protein